MALARHLVIALALACPAPAPADEATKATLVAKVQLAGESAGDVRFSPDGKVLAVLFSGKHFVLWDVPTRKVRDTLKDAVIICNDFAFAPDGQGLVLIHVTRVRALDLKTRKSRELYRHTPDDATALALSPDGKLLASGDTRGRVVVWDYTAGKEVAALKCPGLVETHGIRFYPDGKTLVVAGDRSTQQGNVVTSHFERWLLDLGRKSVRGTLEDAGRAEAMAVSPDGKTLATQGKERGEVRLWDTGTDRVRATYRTKSGYAYALGFSPDGRVLYATGGQPQQADFGIRNPGIVTAWDADTGKVIGAFEALADTIAHLAVSPDGKLLAVSYGSYSGSLDSIAVWDVSALRPPKGK